MCMLRMRYEDFREKTAGGPSLRSSDGGVDLALAPQGESPVERALRREAGRGGAMREPRPYQLEGIQALRQSVGQGLRRIMFQLPTGAGKTLCAGMIAEGGLRKGGTLSFVVPAIGLIDQTVESFWKDGIRDVGVIQADHGMTDWSKPIQVCSIQTIKSRGVYPQSKVVIFDEAHILHAAHKEWMAHPDWQNVPFIGMSATPWARGLGNHFQSLIIGATIKELIDHPEKYLCKFRVFATGHPDMKGVKVIGDDYNEAQMAERMQQGTLTADIIKTWKALWGKGKTLFFGADRTHAQTVQARFLEAGVKCAYQDAETSLEERRRIRRAFHNGEIDVVSNVDTLSMGTDWEVRCLILGRRTRSEAKYVQIIGRGLRPAEGKDELMILDHSDTTQELGFVTDIHYESLRTAKDRAPVARSTPKPKPPWECPECTALNPRSIIICANCKYERKFISGIVETDGELVDVTNRIPKKKRPQDWDLLDKKIFLAELKTYGIEKGRKPGWAAYSYKDRFGKFPEREIEGVAPAAGVSLKTRSWIKSRNIAYIKGKQKNQTA